VLPLPPTCDKGHLHSDFKVEVANDLDYSDKIRNKCSDFKNCSRLYDTRRPIIADTDRPPHSPKDAPRSPNETTSKGFLSPSLNLTCAIATFDAERGAPSSPWRQRHVMRTALLICILGALTWVGCTSVDTVASINRSRLSQLSKGMSKAQVLKIMGTDTLRSEASQGISNPWRRESFQDHSGRFFEIIYYYTTVRNRDGIVSEDELTPIILMNGKLLGWGNTLLARAKKLEIKAK